MGKTGSARWFWLAGAILFAVTHTQSHPFYSNQNQYFLHGMARAGHGDLNRDWLANTVDPTPLFSAFIEVGYRTVGLWPTQALFFAAIVGYALSLIWLVRSLGLRERPWRAALWFALLLALHSAPIRIASDRLLGVDYPWFFQAGLANQYVLGPGLQPSVIGVLLLASIAAFAAKRPVLAAALAAGPTAIHATYLLPAAMLVAGYLVALLLAKDWNKAAVTAIVALLLALPAAIFGYLAFGRTDPTEFSEAQRILAEVRIPHHAVPKRWFDAIAAAQIAWVFLGLACCYRTRLFVPLVVAAGLALIGTITVLLTNQPTLALLFPWRLTAVLVPACSAIILHRSIGALPETWSKVGTSSIVAIAIIAAIAYRNERGFGEPEAEEAVLEYVRQNRQPGELYLIPARFPKPSNARGVSSNTFARPPDPTKPVYFELARFRLITGASLFVDFKSIPYRSDEVLEWHRRVALCEAWFADGRWTERGVLSDIRKEGITHIAMPKSLGLQAVGWTKLFEGGAYEVWAEPTK